MKHKMKRVGESLYECTKCGAEAEGWLELGVCVPMTKPLSELIEGVIVERRFTFRTSITRAPVVVQLDTGWINIKVYEGQDWRGRPKYTRLSLTKEDATSLVTALQWCVESAVKS